MDHVIELEGEITEDGRLVVTLPPDAPRGRVTVRVAVLPKTAGAPVAEATLDAEIEALLAAQTMHGPAETADHIARAPEIGALKDSGLPDGATYVERLRRQVKRRHES